MVDDTSGTIQVTLHINSHEYTLRLNPRVTLLDALREYIGLTRIKKGRDHGQCSLLHVRTSRLLS